MQESFDKFQTKEIFDCNQYMLRNLQQCTFITLAAIVKH